MISLNNNRTGTLLLTLCLIVSFCSSTVKVSAQETHQDSLQADFATFRTLLTKSYPSLYRYTSQIKMDAILDSNYNSIKPNTTDFEFYKLLKRTLSSIKDGHLYCSLPPALQKYREEKAKFFPLQLYFTDQHTYQSASDEDKLPNGSEILSIDNQPIDLIRQHTFAYIVSDGAIQTKKLSILNNFFYFYYYLSDGEHSHYDVKFKTPDGATKQIRIAARTEKEIVKDENENKPIKQLRLTIIPDKTAILTIKSFEKSQLEANGENFPEFLQRSFATLHKKEIKKLIIDLRGNGGGRDTYGPLLYSYLAQKPFQYYKSLNTITTELPYQQFRSNTSSYNNLTKEMLTKLSPNNYKLKTTAHPNLQTIRPAPVNYQGKLWFLIDGQSFSTTAEFCAIAFSNNLGKFIGEETGGTYGGNTSGVQIESTLPNTKIQISFGTVQYNMAVSPKSNPARGIIPQYKIQPGSNDIINKTDVQLNYALKLAKEQ
jgi:C-terminal processing protease CtpA/Prc